MRVYVSIRGMGFATTLRSRMGLWCCHKPAALLPHHRNKVKSTHLWDLLDHAIVGLLGESNGIVKLLAALALGPLL